MPDILASEPAITELSEEQLNQVSGGSGGYVLYITSPYKIPPAPCGMGVQGPAPAPGPAPRGY